MKDIFGKALWDFHINNYTEDIITWTNISKEDTLPLPYLFRSYNEMPKIEQAALNLCKGYVLDVGCGAGNHSLYLQRKGFTVKAIDHSKNAIKVCKARGLQNVKHKSLLEEKQTFDTILMLMNGTGIFQELNQVSKYLKHLKSVLNTNGQILIDSSDIKYMYLDDNEIKAKVGADKLNRISGGKYYGELDYYLSFKGEKEVPIKWLYLDFETLKNSCKALGLHCEKIMDGDHFDYLARIT